MGRLIDLGGGSVGSASSSERDGAVAAKKGDGDEDEDGLKAVAAEAVMD